MLARCRERLEKVQSSLQAEKQAAEDRIEELRRGLEEAQRAEVQRRADVAALEAQLGEAKQRLEK